MKIVIIGGVAGGASCAARLRRLDEKAEITVFERSGYISYANCGLPYYVGGVIESQDALTLQTPLSLKSRFNVDVKIKHEVIKINKENKTVSVKNLVSGEIFTKEYDKLVIATGASPVYPDFYKPNEKIFTLRTVEDTLKIKNFIDTSLPKSATVIGGGFIGLEMAENLMRQNIKVTVVQRDNHLLSTVDSDMASFIHPHFLRRGATLLFNKNVTDITEKNGVLSTHIEGCSPILSDMVILAVGVKPESKLAVDAGLTVGLKGAITVNEHMEACEDIYAVGDAVLIKHFITEKDAVISLAGPANKQGRIAADNICGIKSKYSGTQGSSVIKLFDLTVASTGINEETCKLLNINYEKIILSPLSHAGYYPGATAMTIKALYDRNTKKILGAQIVGYDGVDKCIDVIATAIRAKMDITELQDLELAYAPPYSSAKSPVNMVGFIASNIERGIVKQFYYEDIEKLQKRDDVILLDTRTQFEYMRGHANGFINIPLDSLRSNLHLLDKSKKIYVMCQSGVRSYIATRILMQNSFDAYNFTGGYRFYSGVLGDNVSKSTYPCGVDV